MNYDSVLLTIITFGAVIEMIRLAYSFKLWFKKVRTNRKRRKTIQQKNLKKKIIKLVAND